MQLSLKTNLGTLGLLLISLFAKSQDLFELSKGTISFESNAPQENIQARSTQIRGLINIDLNNFAFEVEVNSFKGFNSELQEEHFYENYLESGLYTKAKFTGKLIDKFQPNVAVQKLRAKGQFEIHGVKKERIIDVVITQNGAVYQIKCTFNILLSDHGIKVPKIVFQKIAENIKVEVVGDLVRK